jgi:hypothetical protein
VLERLLRVLERLLRVLERLLRVLERLLHVLERLPRVLERLQRVSNDQAFFQRKRFHLQIIEFSNFQISFSFPNYRIFKFSN